MHRVSRYRERGEARGGEAVAGRWCRRPHPAGRAIEATIVADGEHRRVALNPTQVGRGVAFLGTCEPTPFPQARRAHEPSLGEAACVHRAAAALAALERDPTWRRPVATLAL